MNLVWAYHDGFQKGPTNSSIPSEFIRYLFKVSIETAPSTYTKVIYVQEEYRDYFKDIVDRVEIFKNLEYTFLNDAKWYAVEKETNAIIVDGDLFFNKELIIPNQSEIGFEYTFENTGDVSKYSTLFLSKGIKNYIPYWKNGHPSVNTGLMYINNSDIKTKILEEYGKVKEFYSSTFSLDALINKANKQPSITGSQYFLSQYLIEHNIEYFNFKEYNNFTHLYGSKKLPLLTEYSKYKTIYIKGLLH